MALPSPERSKGIIAIMSKTSVQRISILIAHRDAMWVDQAKQKLTSLGYDVTDCLEPDWAADLIAGSRPFHLAAVSSELDPTVQSEMLKSISSRTRPPKLLFLLDDLDATAIFRKGADGVLTYRVSQDIDGFARVVAKEVGTPAR